MFFAPKKNEREKPTSRMQCNMQMMVTLPKLNSEFTPEKLYGTQKIGKAPGSLSTSIFQGASC